MPMAIDRQRRRLVGPLGLAIVAGWRAGGAHAEAVRQSDLMAAAWQEAGRHYVGVIGLAGPRGTADAGDVQVISRIEVPTRAHGLTSLPDGRILAVARRPGDWLMRWRPGEAHAHWHWARPGTVFNGHALLAPQAAGSSRVLVTQTDIDSGEGQIGVLDARTLTELDTWPTLGVDPHDLHWHVGKLWVANGGIATQPETGRVKRDLESMDSSLVAMRGDTGEVTGQWRLRDRRLSLRHLAAHGRLLGIALQAEHDDLDERAGAPLLAVFDDHGLQVPAAPLGPPAGGYGGDIAAWNDGFVVSATRANRVLAWSRSRGWQFGWSLHKAGALEASGAGLHMGGNNGALHVDGELEIVTPHRWQLELDNHWALHHQTDS
jgi:uncharacterized protein